MQTFGSSEAPDSLVGRVLPGGLEVVERLGATNEGPLYRGQYSATGPPVAITVLRQSSDPAGPSGTPSLSDMHRQQLRRACLIQHPNVATLLDVGETPDGTVYVVGELLTGELVSDILAVSGGIPPAQAVDICLQVAEGLRAAHAAGVVHGRVSPHTVLVVGGGERLAVKLIRFDFSRYDADNADPRASTQPQWTDHGPDPTDDIVGLGVLLHYLLTGRPPDSERGPQAMPRPLRRIIDRALGARGRPYPTVAALADDLKRQTGAAARRSAGSRLRLAALAAGAALLAAGLWFGWIRLRDDTAEARSEVGTRAPEDSQPAAPGVDANRPRATLGGVAHRDSTPGARGAGSRAAEHAAPGGGAVSGRADFTGVRAGASSRSDSVSTDPAATLSPFRRSHPWAAEPNGRVYFRSSCPQALRATDLIYFTSEAEARATGRTRSRAPGCS